MICCCQCPNETAAQLTVQYNKDMIAEEELKAVKQELKAMEEEAKIEVQAIQVAAKQMVNVMMEEANRRMDVLRVRIKAKGG